MSFDSFHYPLLKPLPSSVYPPIVISMVWGNALGSSVKAIPAMEAVEFSFLARGVPSRQVGSHDTLHPLVSSLQSVMC